MAEVIMKTIADAKQGVSGVSFFHNDNHSPLN